MVLIHISSRVELPNLIMKDPIERPVNRHVSRSRRYIENMSNLRDQKRPGIIEIRAKYV